MPCFWTVVGFTGHRNLPHAAQTREAIASVVHRLAARHPGRLAGFSSAAAGADSLFGEVALGLGIPWLVVLPFAREEFARDFTAQQWQTTTTLLDRAASIQTVPATTDRDEAYLEAGLRTVDESDVVIAVWNGAPAAGTGGTAEVVAYARKVGRPLVWIHSDTGAIVEERMETLATTTADPAQPARSGRSEVEAMMNEFDQAALHHAPAARHITAIVILLHLIASAAALLALMVGLSGGPAYAVAAFKMTCLAVSLWLVFRHRHAHHAWMRTRISAEICRSALASWILPYPEHDFPKIRVPGFERLQRSLRLERLGDRSAALSIQETRDAYLEHRIQDQIRYFSRQLARAAPRHRILRSAASACTIGAITLGLLVLAFGLLHIHGPVYFTVKGLSLLLPLVNAALLAFVAGHDLARRVSRYDEMVRTLDALAVRMSHVRSWTSLDRVATEVETALVQEALEWHSVSRFAAGSH